MLEEFEQLTPPGMEAATWQAELKEITDKLTETCRAVDPTSTEQTIKNAHAVADVVEGEDHATPATATTVEPPPPDEFGAGIL